MTSTAHGVAPRLASSGRVRFIQDETTWNQTVEMLGGSLLQCWQWGEFKALHGWKPFRILVDIDGRPAAAAQALSRSIGPLAVLYMPRGPLISGTDPIATSTLTLAIDRLA
ncbi:MAG: hypothetical protein WD401_06005, partial [Thermomicrobiaceae bacterium]